MSTVAKPWMSDKEIRALELCLKSFGRNINALEWGSGNSTIYFPSNSFCRCQWVSIEHDADWADKTQKLISQSGLSNIEYHHIPATGPRIGDGRFQEFRDYILYPTTLGRQFDFVLVDGRARNDCMQVAWMLLEHDGIMALHDAERNEYQPAFPMPSHQLKVNSSLEGIDKELVIFFKSLDKWAEIKSVVEDSRHEIVGLNLTQNYDPHLDTNPLVSVIMPTYNRKHIISDSLNSVAEQTYKNIELIVVNDAGEDIADLIAQYSNKINIKYENHTLNRGNAASRNTALELAEGKYIAYLDDDDYYYPNHIERLVAFLENSNNRAVYSDAHQIAFDNDSLVNIEPKVIYSEDMDLSKLLVRNFVPNLCLIHHKECLQKVGTFDESLVSHVDWDFLIRLAVNYDIAHIKEVTCAFTTRSDGTNLTSKRQTMLDTLRKVYDKTNYLIRGNNQIQAARDNFELGLIDEIEANTWSQSNDMNYYVSIVIPVFNKWDYTERCINSIYRITGSTIPYEIIIVDNGSNERTRKNLEKYSIEYNNLKVISNKTNLGFAKACNQGIIFSQSKYVVLLNNDTEVTKDWLSELIIEAEQEEKIAILGSLMLYPATDLIQHCGVRIGNFKGRFAAYHCHKLKRLVEVPSAIQTKDTKVVTGACMMLRKKSIDAIGLLDEEFHNSFEDVDICLRAYQSGYRIRYVGSSMIYHHESITQGRHEFDDYNQKRIHDKWFGKIELDEPKAITEENVWEIWAKEQLVNDPNNPANVSILLNVARMKGDKSLIEHWKSRIEEMSGILSHENAISIIIPTYNNIELTKNCIKSVIENSSGYLIEIIIVDNDSSDGTRSYIGQLILERSNIRLITNDKNLGFAKACNRGIRSAKYNYIVLLNNDTIVHPNWLEGLLEPAQRSSSVAAVGPIMYYPENGSIQHAGVRIGTEDGSSIAPYHIHQYAQPEDIPEALQFREVKALTFACVLLKREAIDKIGLLDELYLNGLEDIDYCFRLVKAGYKLMFNPISSIYHFESMSANRHDYDINNWQRLNQKWLGKIEFDESQADTIRNLALINSRKSDIISKSDTNANAYIEEILNNEFNKSKESTIDSQVVHSNIIFSIIIPVHNNLDFTKQCVDGIIKTRGLFPIEVIFIDNNSIDGTAEYLASLGTYFQIIRNNDNLRYAIANNQGAAYANGEYLIFLNNDTYPFVGWLEAIYSEFAKHPNTAIQGAKLLYENGSIQHAGMVWGKRSGRPEEPYHAYLMADSTAPYVNKRRKVQFVTGACLAIRKSVFNSIGGFDEEYDFGCEDSDICMKSNELGYDTIYNPEITLYHFESMTKKLIAAVGLDDLTDESNSRYIANWQRLKSKWAHQIIKDDEQFYAEDNFRIEDGKLYLLKAEDIEIPLQPQEFKSTNIDTVDENTNSGIILKICNDYDLLILDKSLELLQLMYRKAKFHAIVPEGYSSEISGFESILTEGSDEAIYLEALVDAVMSPEYVLSQLSGEKKTEPSKIKILITMYGWNENGGGTTFPKEFAKALVKQGFELSVLFAAKQHDTVFDKYYLEHSIEDGINLYGLFNRQVEFINNDQPDLEIEDHQVVRIFNKLLNKHNPDIVHFHNFLGLSFKIAELAKSKGIFTIFTAYNYHLIDPRLYMMRLDGSKWSNSNFFENSSLPEDRPDLIANYQARIDYAKQLFRDNIDLFLPVSEKVKSLLTNFADAHYDAPIVHQIHNTIDNLKDINKNRPIHDPVVFGYIGSISYHKGVHIIMHATQMLDTGLAEFNIYGDAIRVYLDALIEHDHRGMLKFMGMYEPAQLKFIADEIDIAILPSVWDDCAPFSITESLAMGLPVIAPNIGGFTDYIIHGFNGLIYQHDDIADLANTIKLVASNPNIINLLRNNITIPRRFEDHVDHMCWIYKQISSNQIPTAEEMTFKFFDGMEEEINAMTLDLSKYPQSQESNTLSNNSSQGMNRLQLQSDLPYGFANQMAQGTLPKVLPNPLNLNLGCGNDIREGFVNLDLYSNDHRVVRMDVRKLNFPDDSADLILANDILEHFSHREIDSILTEWARVLKPNGKLIVRCPSLKLQMKAYMRGDWNADIASYMIFGGQTNPGDYHSIAFDEDSIKIHLSKVGIMVVSIEEHDFPQSKGFINLNMTIVATKPSTNVGNISKSNESIQLPLNFEGDNQYLGNNPDNDYIEKYYDNIQTDLPKLPSKELGKPIQKDKKMNDLAGFDFSLDDGNSPIAQAKQLNIVWEGSQFIFHSLALINREICSNLIDAQSSEVTIVPYEPDKFSPEGNPKYEKLLSNDIRNKAPVDEKISKLPYVWIRHQWPPKDEVPRGAKWIIMQPWEYSVLRKDMVEIFNKAFEIWTPSNYSRQSMINSGIDFNKVQVIPNGVDPNLFKPNGDHYLIPTKKKLKLLYVGGTIFRKGIDIMLSAYTKAFTKENDVCLFIKDMGGDSFYKGQTAKEHIQKLKIDPNNPEIHYYDEYLTEEQLANLYRACDILVSPYRGEGFSLPTIEAMACGLPVIVTNGGSTDDFVDEEVGWLIKSTKRSIGNTILGQEMSGEAFVLEPDCKELTDLLRSIYNDPREIFTKGLAAQARARKDWTWQKTTLKLLSRLDYHYGTTLAKSSADKLAQILDGSILLGNAMEEFHNGNYEDAEILIKEAIAKADLSTGYLMHAQLGLTFIEMNKKNYKQAQEHLDQATILGPDHLDVKFMKAKLHSEKREYIDALENFTPIMTKFVERRFESTLGIGLDDIFCETAEAFYGMNDIENAHKLFSEALKLNNSNAYACYGAGKCFLAANMTEEAKKMIDWSIKLKPNFEEALLLSNQLESNSR